MPANRSRTASWRQCLDDLRQRNGTIEIAVARCYDGGESGAHLMWRVRLLHTSERELVVEQPVTLGQLVPIERDTDLVGVFYIGQNRWLFRTRTIERIKFPLNSSRDLSALRLEMPVNVERCQRRNYYRIDTGGLALPQVQVWPLLDPKSVVLAERANELDSERESGDPGETFDTETGEISAELMPEVGPKFTATLLNLGGGGLGLKVDSECVGILNRHKLFWIRCALPPELTEPLFATCKLTHTHIDSSQCTYAGLAFDFTFNPGHKRFVVDQICRYIAEQQRSQLRRSAG